MEIIKSIKWYHVIIVCLFIILIFLIFSGANCTKNICKNALANNKENFKINQNSSPEIIPNKNKNENYNSEIILYYVDWCPYCKSFLPEWNKLENYAKTKFPDVKINKIKCEGDNEKICNKKGISGFPTVVFYKDNKELTYNGERKMEKLVEYLQQNN